MNTCCFCLRMQDQRIRSDNIPSLDMSLGKYHFYNLSSNLHLKFAFNKLIFEREKKLKLLFE